MSFVPPVDTEVRGLFQSDIIIRSAIMIGLQELKTPTNNWLLDSTWGSLPLDITAKSYGEKTIARAKEWFLKTAEIPVFFGNIREDQFTIPSITIELLESAEDTNTVSDTHYIPFQNIAPPNGSQVLYGPFTPISYDPITGQVTLSSSTNFNVFVGMNIVQPNGKAWPITSVNSNTVFFIPAGSAADLRNATLQSANLPTSQVIQMSSAWFKESYRIGVHINSEPEHLLVLHDIVRFILLRHRQDLLEARNFERSTISSSDLARNFILQDSEPAFSRFITINGYTRQYWPVAINPQIQGITAGITVTANNDATEQISVTLVPP